MSNEQPLALRLAHHYEHGTQKTEDGESWVDTELADELRRLAAVEAECDALRADAERSNVYVRELCRGLDAALDFAGTVGGGSSWWVDVWQEHDAAIDAARKSGSAS